jgi:hypothetical protein
LPIDEPEYLSSTTRAVAWGALFFAFLSLAISLATLFLTYRDGVLARNFGLMWGEVRQALTTSHAKPAVDLGDAVERVKVRDQLNRYAQMIQDGDKQALYYLQSLRGDLERLQAYRPKEAEAWLAESVRAIDDAGARLRANAPDAALKLRAMADKLNAAVHGAASGAPDAPPAGHAKDAPEAQP